MFGYMHSNPQLLLVWLQVTLLAPWLPSQGGADSPCQHDSPQPREKREDFSMKGLASRLQDWAGIS